MSTTTQSRPSEEPLRAGKFLRFQDPPKVQTASGIEQIDQRMPLNQLAIKRMADQMDLKVIITADDSRTGVGKTTLAGWLSVNWTWMFSNQVWTADEFATVNPHEYFGMIPETDPGTVLLVDDAEELDARRSMQDLNVKFSWFWELMRLRQLITIITLPSPASIDSRLEELADVWINIQRRGVGLAHDIGVESYDTRDIYTEQVHHIEFPDASGLDVMQKLRDMKEDKMDKYEREAQNKVENDQGDNLPKTSQTFLAVAKKEQANVAWNDVPDLDDRLEYSGEFYRQQSKELLG